MDTYLCLSTRKRAKEEGPKGRETRQPAWPSNFSIFKLQANGICAPSLFSQFGSLATPRTGARRICGQRENDEEEREEGEDERRVFPSVFPKKKKKTMRACYIGGFHPVLYPQQPVPPVSLSIIRQTVLFDWLVVVSYKVAVATSKEGVLLPVHFPGSRGQSAQHNRSRGEPTSNTPITPEEKL